MVYICCTYVVPMLFYSECHYGHWTCTNDVCAAVCSVTGFQSVSTLDGETFQFVPPDKDCAYSLIKVSIKNNMDVL